MKHILRAAKKVQAVPVKIYHDGTLPDFRDYHMKGWTCRYLEEEPLYPFGYGISYSRFRFDDLRLEAVETGMLAGRYTVYAGGSQPDARSRELLGGEDWLIGEVEVE